MKFKYKIMKTSGNTVLISGGSAGIGLAKVKKLNAAGDSKQFFK